MASENTNASFLQGSEISKVSPITGEALVWNGATSKYEPTVSGSVGFTWLGVWSSLSNYVQYDAVSYQGSSYIANSSSINKIPGVDVEWDLFVEKGASGGSTNWLGAYNGATAYVEDDAVSYLGSSYICVSASTGNLPTNPTYWAILALKGDTGSTGSTGATGASIVSAAFVVNDMVFTKDDANTVTLVNAKVDLKGDQGIQGATGAAGSAVKRVTSIASSATPTPDADTTDEYFITALAVNATFGIPTGTPTEGFALLIRVDDNGTPRTLSWNAIYRSQTATLPTTTVTGESTYIGLIYNSTASKWDCISVSFQITGLIKGTGVGMVAAIAGTDYLAPTGSGAALTGITTSQITESTNLNFVSDAQLVVIGNTSGTNTGDQTNITGNAGTVTNGVYLSTTQTLTNKRITSRVVTTTDDSTAVIDVDVTDQYQLTAMANATTISTTGTPTAGQMLKIRLKDNGVARALTWDAVFRAIGVTLPTTTVISKTHYIGCIYNLTDTKWDVVAVTVEA